MMRAMFAAISGLKVHQTMLDVTANDIANVNTVGYKGERTTFKDALSQMQRGASAPAARSAARTQPDRPRRPARLDRQPDGRPARSSRPATRSTCAIQGDGLFRVTDDPTGFGASSTRAPATSAATPTATSSRRRATTWSATRSTRPAPRRRPQTKITIPATTKSVTIGQNGIVTAVDAAGVATQVADDLAREVPERRRASQRVTGNKFRGLDNSGTPRRRRPPTRTASARSRRARSRCRTSTSPRSSRP